MKCFVERKTGLLIHEKVRSVKFDPTDPTPKGDEFMLPKPGEVNCADIWKTHRFLCSGLALQVLQSIPKKEVGEPYTLVNIDPGVKVRKHCGFSAKDLRELLAVQTLESWENRFGVRTKKHQFDFCSSKDIVDMVLLGKLPILRSEFSSSTVFFAPPVCFRGIDYLFELKGEPVVVEGKTIIMTKLSLLAVTGDHTLSPDMSFVVRHAPRVRVKTIVPRPKKPSVAISHAA